MRVPSVVKIAWLTYDEWPLNSLRAFPDFRPCILFMIKSPGHLKLIIQKPIVHIILIFSPFQTYLAVPSNDVLKIWLLSLEKVMLVTP
jgi:hypothetical protein